MERIPSLLIAFLLGASLSAFERDSAPVSFGALRDSYHPIEATTEGAYEVCLRPVAVALDGGPNKYRAEVRGSWIAKNGMDPSAINRREYDVAAADEANVKAYCMKYAQNYAADEELPVKDAGF